MFSGVTKTSMPSFRQLTFNSGNHFFPLAMSSLEIQGSMPGEYLCHPIPKERGDYINTSLIWVSTVSIEELLESGTVPCGHIFCSRRASAAGNNIPGR